MNDIIKTLFMKTITPSTLSSDGNDLVRKILPHLLSSHIDDHDVRQIVSFRVNFLNDQNLKGLLLTQTRNVVRRFIQQLLAGEAFIKTNALQIIDRLEDILNDKNFPELHQKPLKPDNPLLYFHLSAESCDSYPFLAFSCHRALRHVQRILKKYVENASLPRRKAILRFQSIVVPFMHTVRFYQIDENDKLFNQTPSHNKIKEALKRGQEDSRVRYHKDAVVDAYTRVVLSALSGTYSPRSTKNITRVNWGRQVQYGKKYLEEVVTSDEDGAESSKALPTIVNITFDENTEREAAEGAYPTEEAEEIFEAADNDLARVLSLRQISPSRFQSHWSKQSIPLNTYSSFCHAATLKVLDVMIDEELAFFTFLVILIFFGFAPKKTANIIIGKIPVSEEELKEDTVYCDPDGTCIFYRIADDRVASIFAQQEQRIPGVYRGSGNIVFMTTGVITTILKSYLGRTQPYRGARPFLFIYKDAGGKVRRFTLESFESIGKSLEVKCGQFPSAYAFSRSFFNYSTSRYHVDPIVSSYIADRAIRELRAPIFYSNLSSARLNTDLGEMQTKFLTDLARNAENCGIHFNSDIFCTADTDSNNENMENVSFGSKFVPLMISMRETLNSIKDGILGEQIYGLITRYNTYMFYTMLLWELICGFRQIEVERLDEVDVDAEGGLIVICGKGNRLYSESRLIFMHPFVINAFRELMSCKSAFVQSLILSGRYSPAEMSEQLAAGNTFSFANSRGQLIPASSDNVRRFLNATGIRFPYKLNSQRHLLRTFLFDKRVQYKYLAAYFGHQTKGKEFLSFFSLDSLKEIREAISPCIDELIKELEMEIIPHEYVLKNGKI